MGSLPDDADLNKTITYDKHGRVVSYTNTDGELITTGPKPAPQRLQSAKRSAKPVVRGRGLKPSAPLDGPINPDNIAYYRMNDPYNLHYVITRTSDDDIDIKGVPTLMSRTPVDADLTELMYWDNGGKIIWYKNKRGDIIYRDQSGNLQRLIKKSNSNSYVSASPMSSAVASHINGDKGSILVKSNDRTKDGQPVWLAEIRYDNEDIVWHQNNRGDIVYLDICNNTYVDVGPHYVTVLNKYGDTITVTTPEFTLTLSPGAHCKINILTTDIDDVILSYTKTGFWGGNHK